MKRMIWALIALPGMANAHDIVVNWTRPTTYTDGAVMPLTDIASFRIDVGTCLDANTFGKRLAVAWAGAGKTTWRIGGFGDGTYCVRMYTKTRAGLLSDPTDAVSVTFSGTQAFPSRPSGVTVYGEIQ